ncbi:putative membrane protein YdfK [bioreactor metagenome]|uniref:Putative membrane protein YdfK n=1 Tax=bioreactor metagenome TaxID=1076179 RepID=A0A645E7P1_9ZZZZ|nr:DUF554 domain-containing protein [Lachnospiraceae bacterium]
MIGVIVNTITVLVGSTVGLIFKKGIPEKFTKAIMLGIGLCTIYIGIEGALKGENTLILIGSLVLGAIIGTYFDIDGKLNSLGTSIGNRFKSSKNSSARIAEGFVTGSLLFCVGSMTIVGSLNSGLTGDNTMIFTKSMLDLFSSAILSVSLGIGVIFSAIFVFVFQGSLVLLAKLIAPVLTASAIAEMTCAGSVLIIALGLNLIGLMKIKVADYLPAIIIAPVLCYVISLF